MNFTHEFEPARLTFRCTAIRILPQIVFFNYTWECHSYGPGMLELELELLTLHHQPLCNIQSGRSINEVMEAVKMRGCVPKPSDLPTWDSIFKEYFPKIWYPFTHPNVGPNRGTVLKNAGAHTMEAHFQRDTKSQLWDNVMTWKVIIIIIIQKSTMT